MLQDTLYTVKLNKLRAILGQSTPAFAAPIQCTYLLCVSLCCLQEPVLHLDVSVHQQPVLSQELSGLQQLVLPLDMSVHQQPTLRIFFTCIY
jgi:hypothetical protein